MKSSTKLCKLLVLLCEAHNAAHPKVARKRKYNKRASIVTERRYKKASKALAKLATTPIVAEPIKRGRGRPRKNPITPIQLTPEQRAKIDAIKAKIAALSATLPSDRGE